MITFKTYVKEAINPLDPYGEESWHIDKIDDEKTLKIKEKLKEIVDFKDKFYGERMEKYFNNLTKNQGDEEHTYEILEYGDSMWDQGTRIGVVKARSKDEARAIYVILTKTKRYADILTTGFYGSRRITQNKINQDIDTIKKSIKSMQKSLDNLENTKGINNI